MPGWNRKHASASKRHASGLHCNNVTPGAYGRPREVYRLTPIIIQLSPTEWLHLDTMTPMTDCPNKGELVLQLAGITVYEGITCNAQKTYTGAARGTLLRYLEQYADKRGWPALEGANDAL